MPTPAISRAARSAIVSRLSNVSTGFNPLLVAALADAGIPPPAGWEIPITFTAPSYNFFMADVTAEDVDDTTAATYPMMTLFSLTSANRNLEKFQMFAGDIEFGLNVFASWKAGRVIPDFETPMDCLEEAVFLTFNANAIAAWATGPVLVYNGGLFNPTLKTRPWF